MISIRVFSMYTKNRTTLLFSEEMTRMLSKEKSGCDIASWNEKSEFQKATFKACYNETRCVVGCGNISKQTSHSGTQCIRLYTMHDSILSLRMFSWIHETQKILFTTVPKHLIEILHFNQKHTLKCTQSCAHMACTGIAPRWICDINSNCAATTCSVKDTNDIL